MNEEMKKYLSDIGTKGGKSLLAKKGTEHFSKAGKLGAAVRWAKHSKKISTVSP